MSYENICDQIKSIIVIVLQNIYTNLELTPNSPEKDCMYQKQIFFISGTWSRCGSKSSKLQYPRLFKEYIKLIL